MLQSFESRINLNQSSTSMCFLKHIKTPAPILTRPNEAYPYHKTDSDTEMSPENEPIAFFSKKEENPSQAKRDFFLLNFLNLLNLNSQMMTALNQKLEDTQQALSQTAELISYPTNKTEQKHSQNVTENEQNIPQQYQEEHSQQKDSLTTKLFGKQHYRYRLTLTAAFPNTLYKERNFSFAVKLIDLASGKQQKNGNLVNICLAVCDSEGQWVHQIREGTSFIKGKLETELHHGEGQFIKLSPRDVSRSFPNKVIHLVVYAKATLLKYSSESSIKQNINFELIEPLIIRDVSVKAKKRD